MSEQNGPKDPSPGAEAQACMAAIAALQRSDIQAAWQALAPVLHAAVGAQTFALQAQLCFLRGDRGQARQWLAKAEQADADHPDVLATAARLYHHMGDVRREYAARLRRLRLGHVKAVQVVATLTAWQGVARLGGASRDELSFLLDLFEQTRPQASVAHAQAVAEILFSVQGEQQRALSMLDDFMPAGPQERRLLLAGLTPAQVQATGLARLLRADGTARDVQCLEFDSRVVVVPGLQWGAWLPDSAALVEGLFTRRLRTVREDPASPILLVSASHYLVGLGGTAPAQPARPAVLLGSHANYYHFLIDHVSRLAVLDAVGVPWRERVLVVDDELLPFQREIFGLLGIGPDDLLAVAPSALPAFERLAVPMPLVRGGQESHPLLVRWMREQLVRKGAAGAAGGPPVRLYVSRARAQRRRILNEDEITSWLVQQGFMVIHPEDLSVAQQIELFSRATHVVAPGGAALTNMLFMRPGSWVMMLNNRHLDTEAQHLFFVPLARECGVAFHIVSGTPVASATSRVLDADLLVPLAAIQPAVLQAL